MGAATAPVVGIVAEQLAAAAAEHVRDQTVVSPAGKHIKA